MAFWRLREIAQPERWNARKIAEATGLAYSTVWNIWANKSKRADLDTIQALADVLKVEPGTLLGNGELPSAGRGRAFGPHRHAVYDEVEAGEDRP